MLPELNEIKIKRKQIGLTQSELARKANVSQSLLAKIEAGKLQPAYDKVKRLFEVLQESKKGKELMASELMSKEIVSVNAKDTLKKAIQAMEKSAISQMPVISQGKSVGLITEKGILGAINSGKYSDFGKVLVHEIMEEGLPVITGETPVSSIRSLLLQQSGVLIAKKGKIQGIITKADLLKAAI